MITEKSKKMMTKSFEKTKYRFTTPPAASLKKDYGIYIHVPFCQTKCAFCPFYKEIYSKEKKDLYLKALIREIETTDISGTPKWIYFGGGTPNTLSIIDLEKILNTLKKKITIPETAIELLPKITTADYIENLKKTGFTKISLGIESLEQPVLEKNQRGYVSPENIFSLIETAQKNDLWINIDMMTGLPHQNGETFINDMKTMIQYRPSQMTTYPYMVLRNMKTSGSLTNRQQFATIEKAGTILKNHSYQRKGIWIFADGDNIYDSSRDELVTDYVGFGPAAFSTYDNWKVVNPGLDVYLKNAENQTKTAFTAPKTRHTDDWRKFARMIYDLNCVTDKNKFPFYINAFITILKAAGYSKNHILTEKGIYFAHEITKTVVESLPFPLQNKHTVINYDEYLEAHSSTENAGH